jgi:2-keto-4-pentenoate hydratase/2-oxohepta-3-ene-1,7-dioic acid hydratase in catechol pathway
MKFASVVVSGERRAAVEQDGVLHLFPRETLGVPVTGVDDLLALQAREGGWDAIATSVRAEASRWPTLDAGRFQWRPLVEAPSKILCIGRNYKAHAEETQDAVPTIPIVFDKMKNALAAPGDVVPLPRASEQVDYEAELVAVIGRRAYQVAEADALRYVAGYTAGNDVSARDLQFRTEQWLIGKSCERFAPLGPYLVTPDEVGDPQQLTIQLRRNGELVQNANTAAMIFSCAYLIHYLSGIFPLEPGDVIFTGTPEGVIIGMPAERRRWLEPGDTTEVIIERVGRLTNTFGTA